MTCKRSLGTMLSLIVTVIVLLAFGGITVFADENDNPDNDNPGTVQIVASGYCGAEGNGENISWELDSTGLLTISGTGEMKDFTNSPWRNETRIREVVIANGITNIGTYSFNNCTSLKSIDIPDTVTIIGQRAFEGCSSLASINIPNSVITIDIKAFHGCTSLSSIDIPDSVTSIGGHAFKGCSSLASVNIPDSVISIGTSAFAGCTSLASVDIPDSVISIDTSAFAGCTSLASVDIPDSVISIGASAFEGCTSLSSIDIPDSVTSIGSHAFDACENLTDIYLRVNPNYLQDNLLKKFTLTSYTNIYVPAEYYSAYESLLSSADANLYDLDGNILSVGTHLYGYKLVLDGSIGVDFYMKLNNAILKNSDTAFIKFTVNCKDQIVPLEGMSPDKDGYYIFRCNVVAKEMADEITAQFYLDADKPIGNAYTYSVREYAEYILGHKDKYSSETIVLVETMLNYGAASQKYFNHNTKNLANSILNDGEQHTSFNVKPTYVNSGDIKPAKVSLILNSTLTLKLYLNNADITGVTSFKYGSKTLTPTKSGDYTIISIEGLKATQFSSALTIKCYTDETTYKTIKYAPSNYADIVLKQPNGGVITDELKDVVNMLCQFSMAARVYSNSQVGT